MEAKKSRKLTPKHQAVIEAAKALIEDGYMQSAPYAQSAFASLAHLEALKIALEGITRRKAA